jgi:class 3 adenylate cyclase
MKHGRNVRPRAKRSLNQQPVARPSTMIRALAADVESSQKKTKASAPSAVVFADMKDSTPVSQATQDNWFTELVFQHNGILIRAFAEYGGRYIKEVGDEVMMSFVSRKQQPKSAATRAILGAVSAQRDLARFNSKRRSGLTLIESKIGIAWVSEARTFDRFERPDIIKVGGTSVSTAPDLLGFGVNRAARIASIAEPRQIVIDESLYRAAKRDSSLLDQRRISFSEPRLYRKLKGVDEPVVVREVIYSRAKIGLTENEIECLALIDLPHRSDVKNLLRALKNQVFGKRGKFPGQLHYGNLLFGNRSLVLRITAFDLEEHKKLMSDVLKTLTLEVGTYDKSSVMAHSFFIYGASAKPNQGLAHHAVLVLFGLYAETRESMENFLTAFGYRQRIQVYDRGLLFGEFEAFAILSASDAHSLSRMLVSRAWREKHEGVTVRRFEVYPMWQEQPRVKSPV